MRKKLAMIVMAVMLLPLAACGGGKSPNTDPGETSPTQSSETEKTPVSQEASEEIKVAKDGELALSSADIAVVVNGKKVLMPYNLVELENAGVPVNEMFREDELASGDSFSLNLYLDENADYIGNFSIYFTDDSDDAGACEIRLDFMEW